MRSAPEHELATPLHQTVRLPIGKGHLEGELHLPAHATGLVLFVHGSGSSRHSPRNQFVARVIREAGAGTFLFDLLTRPEEEVDAVTGALRFDIQFLAQRLLAATDWTLTYLAPFAPNLGYFGSSTGGAAALVAAAKLGNRIGAVVSRGGRPDLAGYALPRVQSPTLLIVGGADHHVLSLNQAAFAQMNCEKELQIVPQATHLFEEPGALERVAGLAANWFSAHFQTNEEQKF